MNSHATALLSRIGSREARAGVVGLGYVGLPFAVDFARAGLTVTGIDADVDARKVASVSAGLEAPSYAAPEPAVEAAA